MYKNPWSLLGDGHDGKQKWRMRSIRVPERVPTVDVAEGVAQPWSVGVELPGATRQPPRNRKLSLGALTLGTKSNLDLEPGEEWHREVGG